MTSAVGVKLIHLVDYELGHLDLDRCKTRLQPTRGLDENMPFHEPP